MPEYCTLSRTYMQILRELYKNDLNTVKVTLYIFINEHEIDI